MQYGDESGQWPQLEAPMICPMRDESYRSKERIRGYW